MNENDFKRKLGQRIKSYRLKHKYTQEMFSEKIGITQKQISLIELRKSFPSPATLLNMTSFLNCNLKDFFDIDENKENKDTKTLLIETIENLTSEKINILY